MLKKPYLFIEHYKHTLNLDFHNYAILEFCGGKYEK